MPLQLPSLRSVGLLCPFPGGVGCREVPMGSPAKVTEPAGLSLEILVPM